MPPLKPVVLAADESATNVVLTWTQAGPAPNSYEVFRESVKLNGFLAGTVKTYTDSTVVEGAIYRYQVKSTRDFNSIWSNIETVEIPSVPKVIVAPVLAGTAGDTQVSLSWNAVANATAYQLQRKNGGAYANISTANVLTKVDNGLTNGTTYTYRVRGTAPGGDGPWSNEVAKAPSAALPVAPVLTGTPGDSENSLDWNAVANAASYNVRARTDGGPILLIGQNVTATDFVDDTADNGIPKQYTVRGITTGLVAGAISNEVELTAEAAIPGETPTIVGYAAQAGVTGGTDGTEYVCTTFAQYKAAVQASGTRIVKPSGAANIDGGGVIIDIDNGNLTIDGTDYHGSFKRLGQRLTASNVILRNLRLRPGGDVANPEDCDAFTILGTQNHIERVLIDHCSMSWGPDMGGLAVLDDVSDVTIQYSIMGPGLANSGHSEAQPPNDTHHKSANFTTIGTTIATVWPKNITVYRSVFLEGEDRVPQMFGLEGDIVNCVIYNWQNRAAHGNPKALNFVGNMVKQGPGTTGGKVAFKTDTNSSHPNVYGTSVYLGGNGTTGGTNLCIGFAQGDTLQASARRTTAAHGGLVLVTEAAASTGLLNTVCDEAGAAPHDAIDTAMMDNVKSGAYASGSTWYRGNGYGAVQCSWPAPF